MLPTLKPSNQAVSLNFGDSINYQQIWWQLGNESAGLSVKNLASPFHWAGTLQAGTSWKTDNFGAYTFGNGGATGYVDLGTEALPAALSIGPFTIMWLETVDPAATISGFYTTICITQPVGGNVFIIIRNDTGAYASLSCAIAGTTNAPHWASAPTMLSGKGITRCWILTGTGLTQTAGAAFTLMVDGVDYGAGVNGTGNNIPASTGPKNYLGWGSTNGQMPGGVHNARLWTRQLSKLEQLRLCGDPFAGLLPDAVIFKAANNPLYRMFLAM